MRVISAVRHGEENERQFYEALIRLIEDQPAELIDGNPYRARLERVHAAIASGRPLVVSLPSAILAFIAQQTIAARTTEPKTIDLLAKDLADESTQARNQVVESIRMFNAQATSPYTLPGDQIERLYYMTSGVMTVGAEHFSAWKDALEKLRQDVVERGSAWLDTVAFIDALLVVLQGRPTDLPLENPYRPYLHLTAQQVKQMA